MKKYLLLIHTPTKKYSPAFPLTGSFNNTVVFKFTRRAGLTLLLFDHRRH